MKSVQVKTEYLQETTAEWNSDFRVPMHIYILVNGKMVGYVKEDTTKIISFSNPMYFDKGRRKFDKLTEESFKRLIG